MPSFYLWMAFSSMLGHARRCVADISFANGSCAVAYKQESCKHILIKQIIVSSKSLFDGLLISFGHLHLWCCKCINTFPLHPLKPY